MHNLGSFIVPLFTAFVLGLRHGIDWDHIAAITDIVGAVETQNKERAKTKSRAIILATMYAIGHGSIVFLLGLIALLFAAHLPAWIDPIMERVVGGTLIVLACWIFYSLANYFVSGQQLPMQSRWMITMAAIKALVSKITGKPQSSKVNPPSAKTSFAIGTLHAIGAETGTQVLLLTTVGTTAAANNHALGIALLFSFVLGLICSNAMVAMLSRLGFAFSKLTGPVYATTALCTAVFSLAIGVYFLSGNADSLPVLQQLF